MNQSKIAVRYAKALFSIAIDKSILEMVFQDVLLIDSLARQNEGFQKFISNPVNKPSTKHKFINQVFTNNVIQQITLSFLNLLVQNNRAEYIPGIMHYFGYLYRKYKGIKSAQFIVASKPDIDLNSRILQVLKDLYKTDIDLQVSVDTELIGGFILRIEDQQYDASVSTALNKMKSNLLQ